MRILIFDGRFPSPQAKTLAEELRSDGHNVGFRNADRFTGNVERLVERVYADSEEIRAAYADVDARPLTGEDPSTAEYELETRGRWYYVTGPDGDVNEKGLTKDEADALLAEVTSA